MNQEKKFSIDELYEKQKNKLLKASNKFQLTDDLKHLAEVIIIGERILKQQEFPFKEYKNE